MSLSRSSLMMLFICQSRINVPAGGPGGVQQGADGAGRTVQAGAAPGRRQAQLGALGQLAAGEAGVIPAHQSLSDGRVRDGG